MVKHVHVARVVNVAGNGDVTFLIGSDYHTQAWPQNAAKPGIGDVYDVSLTPEFKVNRQLATPDGDEGRAIFESKDGDALRWRKPDANGKTRMQALADRHIIKRAVRDYLHDEGFLEIDMPLLVNGTTPDVEIESFRVDGRYLQTSTEYPIKRMEIGGFDKMYTLTQNWRKGDYGVYRNQEFTMLEWARVGGTLHDIETDVENFTLAAHEALGGTGILNYQGHEIDLSGTWDRITVRDAVMKHANVSLPDFSTKSLAAAVKEAGIHIGDGVEKDKFHLFTLLIDHIERKLGFGKPVFMTEWPIFQTSSAANNEEQKYANRSELFIAGVEISDGFPSQTDYYRQITGFKVQQDRRIEEGKQTVDLDAKYLRAMREGFPSGAGKALGFDRLVMVLTDRPDIHSVLAFSWDEL